MSAMKKHTSADGSFVIPSYYYHNRWVACDKDGCPIIGDDRKVIYCNSAEEAIELLRSKGLWKEK